MDHTESRIDVATLATPVKARPRRIGRSKAAAQPTIMVEAIRADFEAMAAAIREELAPVGAIETIQVERAIVAAWRLREAVEADRARIVAGSPPDLSRRTDRAERSLRRVLNSLNVLRRDSRPRWGRGEHPPTVVTPLESGPVCDADLSNEWPVLPAEENDDDDAAPPRWQDRLVFDFNVSNESPVIRGTWITVAQVVTLIVDGQTWADILRSHPELTEDDLRVCLSYATEQENDDSRGLYLP